MVNYMDCINDLDLTLNFKSTNPQKAKENKQIFLNALNTLKSEYKTDVSTTFLMGFVRESDDKQKSNRVTYMLKSVGLNERVRVVNSFLMTEATTTSKNVEILVYSKIDKNQISKFGNIKVKSLPMTSTDYNGIKAPCKVGITARRLKSQTLHNIKI